MPYKIVKSGDKYKVINEKTGKVHAKGTTKAKAEAQIRFLGGIEHGMKQKPKK